MQVKNFGRSGRTKYTHLVDQDTSARDAPWAIRDDFSIQYLHNYKLIIIVIIFGLFLLYIIFEQGEKSTEDGRSARRIRKTSTQKAKRNVNCH